MPEMIHLEEQKTRIHGNAIMIYEYFWKYTDTGGIRLLRVYGQTSEVYVPEQLEGHPVTEIGAYCFAGRTQMLKYEKRTRYDKSSGEICSSEDFSAGMTDEGLRELAGQAVERVIFPDCVKKIESYAFYQCTKLAQISLGGGVQEVGGDAFMNCHKLHHMTVRSGCQTSIGIRQILAQITSDMEVTFEGENGIKARLFFPEYYESYDEIAPAHLFGRNIEGEGFRARQCVRDGAVDFRLYDTIFPKACAEEREKTLCRIAMNRLLYPVELGETERILYEGYIGTHAGAVCASAVCAQDEETVWFLCEQGLLTAVDIDVCIRLATEQEWAKGAASFLRAKERFFPPKPVEERYSFDDF